MLVANAEEFHGTKSRVNFFPLLREWQAWVVLSCALTMMVFCHFVLTFFHPPFGDSDADFYMARYILGMPNGVYISTHAPGMALFLIFSGVMHLETWRILIASYDVMAIAIPCMIYMMMRPASRNWAMILSCIIIAGMIPYIFARVDSYDELFLFLEFLSFLLATKYLLSPQQHKRMPLAIALIMFAANLVKPIAAMLFWVFWICALITPRVNRYILLAAAGCFMACMAVWAALDRNHASGGYAEWYAPASLKQRRFAETYYQPSHWVFQKSLQRDEVISETDGPASAALYGILRDYIEETAENWMQPKTRWLMSNMPQHFFGQYAQNHSALLNAIFKFPNAFYFNFMRQAVQEKLDRYADDLFIAVAKEHGNVGLKGWGNFYLHNIGKIFTGPQVSMGWRNLLGVFTFMPERNPRSWNIFIIPQATPIVTLNAGVYTKEFFSQLKFFIEDMPAYWEHSNFLFEKFTDHPNDLYNAFLTGGTTKISDKTMTFSPADIMLAEGWYYMNFISLYGQRMANELFKNMALEIIRNYPASALMFLDNFLNESLFSNKVIMYLCANDTCGNYTFGKLIHSYLQVAAEIDFTERDNHSDIIGPNLNSELPAKVFPTAATHFVAMLYTLMHVIAPIFLVTAILLLIVALLSPMRYVTLFLFTAYLYFVAVFAVFGNFGSQRYSDIFILIPIILTGIGLGYLRVNRKNLGK